ncbi:glycosyltransferase family 2 protein [Thioalkalivibrio paradoxus]|uniref:Glycosyl transferase family 2 n=1 Tax=Thioalkalivibrio paradoxus ARh 1 TaxID=713585 RepID=W0DNU1_9GAMM|nr:glycosyltransferase family 2 protein [Thioalkalivibrio paradoxus]AHE98550.1 glycosyl transferase family 2 [Thioalkalivibrio paradoxus ARh 1]
MPAPAVSVIIVSFNSGPLLLQSVQAALGSSLPVQVLVSDNGSEDGSMDSLAGVADRDPRVELYRGDRNRGFAAAANRVLPQAQAPWLLFLNPDCLLEPDTLARMLAVLEDWPDAGIAGPLIRNADGSEQPGGRRREPTPWRSLARVLGLQRLRPGDHRFADFNLHRDPLPDAPVAVDAISGAFMLARRAALDRVGPLDEGYFLHCEDLDWCRRFRDAGFTVLFVPQVAVVHHKGVSSRARPVRVEWHKHRGMMRYYRKFFLGAHPRPLFWLVGIAVWARFVLLAAWLTFERRRS